MKTGRMKTVMLKDETQLDAITQQELAKGWKLVDVYRYEVKENGWNKSICKF